MDTAGFAGIRLLEADEVTQHLAQLAEVLQDAVESGASIGFLPPFPQAEALDYWMSVRDAVTSGRRLVLAAFEGERLVGAVQLDLESRRNGLHRAEVMKLCVHRQSRRRGIGLQLMKLAEQTARVRGRTLLVLDTRRYDDAERLYRRLGYESAGIIPQYALGADGRLHDTVFFYKRLSSEVAP
jgi:ribosomal protein S18 acetylase RimI-like enzyme